MKQCMLRPAKLRSQALHFISLLRFSARFSECIFLGNRFRIRFCSVLIDVRPFVRGGDIVIEMPTGLTADRRLGRGAVRTN